MTGNRMPFEIDVEIERGVLTGHGGIAMLIELFQATGANRWGDPERRACARS